MADNIDFNVLAVEYISMLKRRDYDMENEIAGLRREIEMIKRGCTLHTGI